MVQRWFHRGDVVSGQVDLHMTQNPNAIIILMTNWPIYLIILQTHLQLIKLLVLMLIQRKLKPTFPISSAALSLLGSIISYSNVTSISMLILHNLIWTLRKSTL